MNKKDILIYCSIILVFFLFFILNGVKLPLAIIGILAFILYLWADSKEREEITKKTMDEVKKMLDEQSSEKTMTEKKDNTK